MKKKLLFTFACVMALMAGFVSCTNDDFEEFAPVAEMQKSAMTRAVGGMTQEEVQARLDELGEKYGASVMIADDQDISSVGEDYFTYVDNFLKNGIISNNNAVQIMNDECIDEVAVASSSLAGILLEDGVLYSGRFLEPTLLNCIINWAITSNPITYYVSAEPNIKDGTTNAFIDYFSPFSGDLSNPRFGYTGVYYSLFPSEGGGLDEPIIIDKPLANINNSIINSNNWGDSVTCEANYDKNNDGLIDSEYYNMCYKLNFVGGKTEDTEPYDM